MKMMNKKAEAGIGTLILFIAMILVAAIAAGVLISTATSLQSKALFTGSQAQGQVSSQAVPIYLYGKDASSGSPRQINVSFLKLKLAPGSDAIKLEDAVLQVDTSAVRSNLLYDVDVNCSIETDAANGIFNDTSLYGARWLIGQSNGGYLERGDVIELCFPLPVPVGEGEDLRITFVPAIGSPGIVETKTPDVMLEQQVQLFP